MTVRVMIPIVTHNSAEVIAECVERLAGLCDAADFQVEIVVADNPSRDGTIGILHGIQERRPQIPFEDRTVQSESRLGGW
jgi:glycosyltransferase involved in cell wall biosynthesis